MDLAKMLVKQSLARMAQQRATEAAAQSQEDSAEQVEAPRQMLQGAQKVLQEENAALTRKLMPKARQTSSTAHKLQQHSLLKSLQQQQTVGEDHA